MAEKLLKISGLSVEYRTTDGVVHAVDDLSLELEKGETLGLVGETGAGKTTTALSVMRLVPNPPGVITGGAVEYKGKDFIKESEESMQRSAATKCR